MKRLSLISIGTLFVTLFSFANFASATTALCTSLNAPYYEDFNNVSAIPQGFITSSSSYVSIENGGHSGKCLKFVTSITGDNCILFPEINLNSNNVEVSLFIRANSIANTYYSVGICSDTSDIGVSFEPFVSDSLSNYSWNEIHFNTASTTLPVSSTTRVAIILPQVANLSFFIDDVSITAIPSCPRPENLSITNVTATTATASWTSTSASNCRIYAYSPTDTSSFLVNSSPATISGLTPNTDYTFQIRAICSSSDSSVLNPNAVSLHTKCLIADSALFFQGFEGISTANTAPDCWQMGWLFKPSGNNATAPFSLSSSLAHSGSNSFSLVNQVSGSRSYLASQQLPIDSAGKYSLSVWVYRQNASAFPAEGLRFWVNSLPDDTTGATLLGFIPRNYSSAPAEAAYNTWYNYEYVINRAGNLYVIIEGLSDNGGSATCFDDVQVKLAPACPKVSDIALSNISASNAVISWTPGRNEQQWIVNYTLTQGSGTVRSLTDTVNSPSLNISGLTSATTYNATGTVTALCSANDLSEAVAFNINFVTACPPVSTLPYLCGFEANELPALSHTLPLCWNRHNNAAGSYNYYPYAASNSANAHNGSGYLCFYGSSAYDYGSDQVALFPQIDISAHPINTLRVTLYARASSASFSGMVRVGVVSNPSDISSFSAIDSFSVSGTNYSKHETRFSNYTGSGSYIALWYPDGSLDGGLFFDDAQISLIPACADLDSTGVYVANVTGNSATVWLVDPTATDWSYAFGPVGTPASACTPIDTNASIVTITNLSPQTDYVIYARRKCGSLYGDWSAGVSFRTGCGVNPIPFSDDFEDTAVGPLAGCYSVQNPSGHSLITLLGVVAGSNYNHTPNGSKGVSSYYNGYPTYAYSNDEFTMLALVHLEANKNYEISLYARTTPLGTHSYRNYWDLSFVYGASESNTSVISTYVVNTASFTRYAAYLNVPATGDYYVGIKAVGNQNASSNAPCFDDFLVQELACIPPLSSMVDSLTSNSAFISLTSSASQWEVAVSASPININGVVSGEAFHDTVSSSSFAVGGLNLSTQYYYTVRSICTNGGVSAWMQPDSFRTLCSNFSIPYSEGFESPTSINCWTKMDAYGTLARETYYKNSGAASMRVYSTSAALPEANVSSLANYSISGFAYSTYTNGVFYIAVANDLSSTSAVSPSIGFFTFPNPNTWVEFTLNLDTLNSPAFSAYRNARYIIIGSSANFYFDDIYVDVIPTCPKPTSGTITSVAEHQAVIDWNEAGNASSWLVSAVPETGSVVSAVTSSHPFTLTGLDDATDYTIYVRALCSQSDSSRELLAGTFTTECDIFTTPYNETFEGMKTNKVPVCWDNSASTSNRINSNPQYIFGVYKSDNNNSIRMFNYYVQRGDALINTPEIILQPGLNYQLRYDYCNQSSVNLLVKVKRRSDSAFTTLATYGNNGYTSSTTPTAFSNAIHDLSAYAGDTIQVQFFSVADYGSGSIFVDNIMVMESPTCVEPLSVSLDNITHNGATAHLMDTVASHSAWQYVVGTIGFDPATATPVTIYSDSFQIANLNHLTSYDLYVRSQCSSIDYSVWVKATFQTTAAPPAFPYYCDFTDSVENSNWVLSNSTSTYSFNSFMIGNDSIAAFTPGGSALYVSNAGSYSYDNSHYCISAASRLLSLSSSSYNIEFDWKCSGGELLRDFARFYLLPDSVDVYPLSHGINYFDFTWPSGLIPLDGSTPNCLASGVQHFSTTLDMTGREGSYNLVFIWANNYNNGDQYPFSVSNISIRELTCLPVTDISIISDSLSGTDGTCSVSLSCTNPNPGSTTRWVLSTSNLISDSIATGIASSSTDGARSVSLSGLNHSTTYYLFLRAECSSVDFSSWVAFPFNTPCGTVTSFPFSQGFESDTFPPLCWSTTSLSSGTVAGTAVNPGSWMRVSYTNVTYGNGKGYITVTGGTSASALLASPLINFEADRQYHLSFSMYHYGYLSENEGDRLNVYLGSNANNTSGATLLTSLRSGTDDNTSGVHSYDFDLPDSLSGDYYLLFEGLYTNGFLFIDDITVDRYPRCRNAADAPTITASTSTTISLSMPLRNSNSQIQFGIAPYSLNASPADITSTIISNSGSATFTALTPASNYSLFARAICASCNDTAEWSSASMAVTKADDCFAPDALHTVGITGDTSISIAWNIVPDVTSYQCILTDGSSADTSLVSSNLFARNNLTANTAYTIMVRGFCGANDTTGWSSLSFHTTTHPAQIPYSTGFEISDDNADWQFTNSSYNNNFIVGNDPNAHNSGSYALYISDNGSSLSQSIPTDSSASAHSVNIYGVSYASRTIYFPAAGYYDISFDWMCDPVITAAYGYYNAYGRAFLAPTDAALPADNEAYKNSGSVPAGGFLINGTMTGSQTWQRSNTVIYVPDSNSLNLVFMWCSVNRYGYADDSETSDYPLAIDNISVTQVNCLPVNSISIITLADTFATVAITKPDTLDLQYALLTVNNPDSISSVQTKHAPSLHSVQTEHAPSLTDTLFLSSLSPNTQYYLFVRTRCDSANYSDWRSFAVKTIPTPATLPYICDFENTSENNCWNFTSGSANPFIIGTNTSNGGTRSLYVSDDGSSNHYNTNSISYSYAYRPLYLPAGFYEYSFDWKADGTDLNSDDYGRAFLLPASVSITGGKPLADLSYGILPPGAISLDYGILRCNGSNYATISDTLYIQQGNSYNLVFFWTNDYSSGTQPPLSIDNVSIVLHTCLHPYVSILPGSVTDTSATAIIYNNSPNSQLVYAVTPTSDIADAVILDTLPVQTEHAPSLTDTLLLSGLSPSSSYQLMVASICDSANQSIWSKVSFKTECGAVTYFPYTQGFESLSNSSSVIDDICWSQIGDFAYYPGYSYISVSNLKDPPEGDYALMSGPDNYNPLYLILPEMSDINSLKLSFKYISQSTATFCGTLYVGYMTDPTDTTTFVSLYTCTRTMVWTSVSLYFANAPAGSRIAFRHADAYNNWFYLIDDVIVSRLERGATYNDTICNNSDYYNHGFTIPAFKITVGDNTFTRIVSASTEGAPDTLCVANVYMRAPITFTTYDTICAGQPYNSGRWTIPHPQTTLYSSTFYGAAACGCDSAVELYLTVIPTQHVVRDTFCMGDSYTFGDTTITNSGTYRRITTNAFGCSDTIILYLTAVPTDSTLYVSFCQGGYTQVRDTFIQDPGLYTLVRPGFYNCDMTYHIHAAATSPTPADVYDYACEGSRYYGYGVPGVIVNNDTVIYVSTYTYDGECDSLIRVNLTLIPTLYTDTFATITAGETFSWHNLTCDTTGDYSDTLRTAIGCDSIVTLHLTVTATGVEDAQTDNEVVITIIPNPAPASSTATLYLVHLDNIDPLVHLVNIDLLGTLDILSSTGTRLYTITPDTYPITLRTPPTAGIYYIRLITTAGDTYVQKLIVK